MTRLAVIETRLPASAVFLVRDLRALIASGVTLDLYLLDTRGLDPGLKSDVERAGGEVRSLPLPWSREAAAAFLGEAVRHPLRLLGSLGMVAALFARAPAEAMRAFAVLPGALAAGPRMSRSGVTQTHALWAGVPASTSYWIRRHHGIPYSFSAHAWDLVSHTRMLPRKARAARGMVVCSEWGRSALTGKAGAAAAGRVHLVHHGLDLAEWRFRERSTAGEAFLLGVGRLTRVKGFDDLVRAAAGLHRRGVAFRCEIIGSDERGWGEELRALAASLEVSDRVIFRGECSSADVRSAMARADLLVWPFVDTESAARGSRGIPNVVPEAMAVGLPVVATNAGGLLEMVRDGETGKVVPQRDPEALAAAIEDLLARPEIRKRMAGEARHLVEETHDLRRTTRAFLEAIGAAPAAREEP